MGAMTPIRRVLVANRGEIAIRIARGARAAGIVPLGIYSDADRDALYVGAMDDALRVGPATAAQSYLAIDRVVAAAVELNADAVHPGYGFLSERAEFAAAVRDAGLVFVGPTPEAIAQMGDKSEAKRRARAHGVPVVPGYDGDDLSPERLRAEAQRIGTPLIVKASAGGGGRGMRVVDDLAHFDEALGAAKREALAAFGDDRVLLERYVARPRHVEFQILADRFGKTIHLGERECSIQRRHQKIIEEAPSLALDPELRERMGSAAIAVARSVAYTNAGTVEFLLDGDGAFYFLEMNARLQVEHPVTELVHGVDLVALQFSIANGEPLVLEQHAVAACGWAIEARVNAEDPAGGYLPSSGTIARFDIPEDSGARFDVGYAAGSEVSVYYDSLLGKIIAHGADRVRAIHTLADALARVRIDGIATNLPLLRAIANDPAFRAGDTTTAYLSERALALEAALAPADDDGVLLALAAFLEMPGAWRIGRVGIPLRLVEGGRTIALVASRGAGEHGWRVGGDLACDVTIEWAAGRAVVVRDGRRITGSTRVAGSEIAVVREGRTATFALAPPPALGAASAARGTALGAVTSPMPGKIVKIAVCPGDVVAERDLLVVLEAMKMEHRIEAMRPGTVGEIAVAEGALVAGGATLMELA
ncbi:MAG: acetyl-CoA carboxylase biotin carboxylase subunit [Vulcanimicrobiaceae bacterium]